MTASEKEKFQLSNICWICGKLIDLDNNKVKDHCHIFGKYRGSSHWKCNISSVMWGLLAHMGSGFFQILNHLKTLKYH